jgi:hypothetical protein
MRYKSVVIWINIDKVQNTKIVTEEEICGKIQSKWQK